MRQVSILKSIDKMTCYKIDKYILSRLLQGYEVPNVTHKAVDEVYARGPRQQKSDETRDDLFFDLIGESACARIQVVATDQHDGYGASVKQYCKNAKLVWDRFHLVQHFNELINDERKTEVDRVKDREHYQGMFAGKQKWMFLKRACHRTASESRHINEILQLNDKMAKLELIKERFHQMFDCTNEVDAENILFEVYQWACQLECWKLVEYLMSLRDAREFWNYFTRRFTTAVVEGINRGIKTLKWVAYGYKDMAYFALKIMQKFGYSNHKYALNWLYPQDQ